MNAACFENMRTYIRPGNILIKDLVDSLREFVDASGDEDTPLSEVVIFDWENGVLYLPYDYEELRASESVGQFMSDMRASVIYRVYHDGGVLDE